MKNIAVVMGGFSAEKVVSLKSGMVAMKFLDKNRYNTYSVIIDNEGWRLENNGKSYPIDKSDFSVNIDGQKIKFDGVFMAIHGAPGENGVLQHYLDNLNIPYTCSGVKASELSFDKCACNDFLRSCGILCAESIKLEKGEQINCSDIIKKLGLPCFVKPNGNGSSFGVGKVKYEDELIPDREKAFEHDNYILIESLLIGTEVTCGVHNLNQKIDTFPMFDYKVFFSTHNITKQEGFIYYIDISSLRSGNHVLNIAAREEIFKTKNIMLSNIIEEKPPKIKEGWKIINFWKE